MLPNWLSSLAREPNFRRGLLAAFDLTIFNYCLIIQTSIFNLIFLLDAKQLSRLSDSKLNRIRANR